MGYTKRQFVEGAYEELGITSYDFDLQSEDLESAMRRLDSMMAEWNAKGIRLSYPLPGSPLDGDLSEPSQVPDSANEAIITNLGIRLAPQLGKTVAIETKATAKAGYNTLLARASYPPKMQFPSTMPRGAGNKPRFTSSTFMPTPVENIDAGADSSLSFDE
jgi:hypothetical protein